MERETLAQPHSAQARHFHQHNHTRRTQNHSKAHHRKAGLLPLSLAQIQRHKEAERGSLQANPRFWLLLLMLLGNAPQNNQCLSYGRGHPPQHLRPTQTHVPKHMGAHTHRLFSNAHLHTLPHIHMHTQRGLSSQGQRSSLWESKAVTLLSL